MFAQTYYILSLTSAEKMEVRKNLKTNLRIFKLKKYSHVKQANYMKNRNFTKLATPPLTPTKSQPPDATYMNHFKQDWRLFCSNLCLRQKGDLVVVVVAAVAVGTLGDDRPIQTILSTDNYHFGWRFFFVLFSTLHC